MAPDERRAAIVDATLPLVLRHGAGVSTRQIAEAADVAEGTIYRVFPDKGALMGAVREKAFDPSPMLRDLAEVDASQPLRERLVAAVAIMQRQLTGVFGLIEALGLTRPPQDDRRADAKNEAVRAAMIDLIGADERDLRVDAAEMVHVLRLLVFSGTHHHISAGRPLGAEQIVAILLDGLSAPALCHHHHTGNRAC